MAPPSLAAHDEHIDLDGKKSLFWFRSFTSLRMSKNAKLDSLSISPEVSDTQMVKHLSAAGQTSTPSHRRQSKWVQHHVERQLMTISGIGIIRK
jgi:hypothetical protein